MRKWTMMARLTTIHSRKILISRCPHWNGTHKGLEGAALTDYLWIFYEFVWNHQISFQKICPIYTAQIYFPRNWVHFDMKKIGHVGVEVMPQLIRFLVSDLTFNFLYI